MITSGSGPLLSDLLSIFASSFVELNDSEYSVANNVSNAFLVVNAVTVCASTPH